MSPFAWRPMISHHRASRRPVPPPQHKPRKWTRLDRRCPCCKQLRGFIEPPGDQGGERHRGRAWYRTPFGLACGYCVVRYASPDVVPADVIAAIERDLTDPHYRARMARKDRP